MASSPLKGSCVKSHFLRLPLTSTLFRASGSRVTVINRRFVQCYYYCQCSWCSAASRAMFDLAPYSSSSAELGVLEMAPLMAVTTPTRVECVRMQQMQARHGVAKLPTRS
jgi:hypothetical protein